MILLKNWFDDEGRTIERAGIEVIAWMSKFIPEPCK